MKIEANEVSILIAEDDADDRMFLKEAFSENSLPNMLKFVEDGAELLDFLHKRGKFLSEETFRPGLILLDLNMPKVDGREALKQIKSDPSLKRIPVVVLTTSRAEEDITHSYDLGVNSFISKPSKFSDLVTVARQIGSYWCRTVELPKG